MSQVFGLKSLLPLWEKGFRDQGKKVCQSTRVRSGFQEIRHFAILSKGFSFSRRSIYAVAVRTS
jgi:hypothetical protein